MISNSDHTDAAAKQRQLRQLRQQRNRSRSSLSADPEEFLPSRPPSPPGPNANAPPPSERVTRLRLSAHYAVLVLSSMLGCVARVGLNALCTYDGKIIYALAWSQGIGSGVMGLALAKKNEMTILYPPLYTFLTTGIAGCITTFSSWMLEGYLSFSNFNHYNRNGLHDTVDGVAYSLSTFAIALSCLHFGEHFGSALPKLPYFNTLSRVTQPEEKSSSPSLLPHTPILDILTILTAFLAYLIALLLYFLAPRSWRHDVVFPLLMSPPGAILRFSLSNINIRHPFINRFPLGTFISNIVATLLIAGTFAAQRRPNVVNAGNVRCNALYAIQQGFCGCLSTVSTFVVESRAIEGWRWKWLYVGTSVILGHVLVLAVVGGTGWSEGYVDVCTG
ncbi:hypothetical protein J010_05425 [Cryptococcus neoformans]|nr:hypothetical protein C368_05745 [Cryptococcus neoformans var. grubii 125.91]OXG46576.1 hypothetical protein C355_05375 [Cryptococcus neoformans var. grubii Th84]OXG75182.1 hypothetical protein C350_05363 [Cryptococcus neoformans var. grubii MW-RSA36]OXH04008.1 hypothetical protein J010_05425 [Cryptococcus neoformans var. grubii]OXL06125.1 hypothetical protein C348_05605 [Cryptococcus neoformans var. grubii Gb118]